jgi:mannose-6-phosphate isomerase-like protein (cupin superfamily)
MIKALSALIPEAKVNVRGGVGPATSFTYLKDGEMDGVTTMARTILEPGSSVGEHLHPDTEEIWLIVEGHGTVILDGVAAPVGPGDLMLTKAGHSHGLNNSTDGPMVYLGLLTRQA